MDENIKNEAPQSEQPEKQPSPLYTVFDWISMIALYFSIAMLIFLIFFTLSPVVGNSMNPTLQNGDVVILSKFAYTPKNGDIIVCQSESFGLDEPLIKRIIATEGQKVQIDYQNRKITVDGKVLDEDYITGGTNPFDPSTYLEDEFTVPKGKLFVMGDNRTPEGSADSRSEGVGFIDERYVMGKVVLRLFPLNSIKIF